ncbi:asparaginase domain-containing protein [Acidobacteria bacterium AH-259-D05]|nr:asparaginase domain-containing protein [Acidobacteria bacterium AH-259-D05]
MMSPNSRSDNLSSSGIKCLCGLSSVLPLLLTLLLAVGTLSTYARAQKPKIAVFSGPTATIQNSQALVTSNKAREKHGLPLLNNRDGTPLRFDALRAQRLAAPVSVYVEAFSAHPLEQDMGELYAPPDGYINGKTGAFSKKRQSSSDIPVYQVDLRPEDGLYLLPYMALQADGGAWDGHCAFPGAPPEKCRVPFYPDASRIFEEIDRFGLGGNAGNNLLSSKADFDFYRPAPSGGYRKGLPANHRTDVGSGDIPNEIWGEDFFTYTPLSQQPAMPTLARLTNRVQRTLANGTYAGAIWLEGSPTTEETTYWLNLLIDTTVPIVGNSSQRTHGMLSNDGDRNIVDSVDYIVSGIWKDTDGLDKVGAVMIQEEQIFTARDVQKGDDRPGGYVATGGHGGIIGGINPLALTFVPAKKHTYSSQVNMSKLPTVVQGVRQVGDGITNVQVSIKDEKGDLLSSAIPKVSIAKYARYLSDSYSDDADSEVEILARIEKNLQEFELSGFVLEGIAPYASHNEPTTAALRRAVLTGMPVVRVGRGNHEGITSTNPNDLFIEGNNLTATKARLLLMACLMKFGSPRLPADLDNPTKPELDAIGAKIAQYQAVFDSH